MPESPIDRRRREVNAERAAYVAARDAAADDPAAPPPGPVRPDDRPARLDARTAVLADDGPSYVREHWSTGSPYGLPAPRPEPLRPPRP